MSEKSGSAPVVPGVVAVVGATATGKSDLGVELALRLGGEVVNADSMQLYRGMDIGTAKVTPEQRRGVPHHLLDVWSVREPASVATYQRLARETIAEVAARGAVAVLVGGSGLYLRAALDHLDFPGTDAAVRARLERELAELGGAAMHARLAAVDPEAAAAIPAANSRRVVRALEVVEITGAPYTASHARPPLPGAGRADRPGAAPGRAAHPDRPSASTGCGSGAWSTRSAGWSGRGCARGRTASRALGLRPGAAPPRRGVHRGGGPGGDRAGDPAVRPPPGQLVPARPAGPVGAGRAGR